MSYQKLELAKIQIKVRGKHVALTHSLTDVSEGDLFDENLWPTKPDNDT